MKVICLKKHLKDAIGLCEKITGKNLSLPILGSILISGKDHKLKLAATNLEIGLEMDIPAKIEKEGSVAVPAGIASSFLSSLAAEENITLESQNNNLTVLTRETSTMINGQPPEDFPLLPAIKEGMKAEIPASDFVSGLKSVWYAASFLDIKPEISSVFVFPDDKKLLTFAATDSFRLAEKKTAIPFPGSEGFLLPMKSVAEILRIFDGRSGKIKLIADKNQIFFLLDGIRFVSRLTEGVFPDYHQIIPDKFVADVVVDKNLFIANMRTAGIFSGKLNEVVLVTGSAGLMTISTTGHDSGEHTAGIAAKTTGEELKMSFNHKYIFDCLQHIPSKEIILRFSGEGRPLVIMGVDDNSFQYLVMPMNTL